MKTLKEILSQPLDLESFMVHEHIIGGETVRLIQPQHIGCKWTQDNSIFRSLVIDSNNNIVSASWKKFVNWGEKPEHFPVPKDITKCELVNKEDGSTAIFSLWKKNLVIRTRGTVDATKMDNGHEIAYFQNKYPQIMTILEEYNESISMVFEWLSPLNQIVLKVEEPELILTGIIYHEDYSYMPQAELDDFASNHKFKRPIRYRFKDLAEMLEKVPSMKGIEGLCVYHQDGQQIHKLKTETYLQLHRFKEHANIESVIDLYFGYEKPSYSEFEEKLTQQFDWECFNMVRGFASQVCDGMKEVNKILSYMNLKVDEVRHLSKKDAALTILQAYGETNRSQFAFSILNGKPLTNDQVKKLLYQVLKNS